MKALWRSSVAGLTYALCVGRLWAGGSGLNVVVVVNQNSTNSVELGNYYCEKRQVPPQNLLRVDWPLGNVFWSLQSLTNFLLNPLLTMLSDRQLTNQIDYVVLSMDLPYNVSQGGDDTTSGVNSTTSTLFYGFKPDGPAMSDTVSCNLPDVSSNSYAGSEAIFRLAPPLTATAPPFLAMMVTSSNLAEAKAIIDRGVRSDATFPVQPVVLAKTFDIYRNIRYLSFDDAIFNTRLRESYSMYRTYSDSPSSTTNILGYETGLGQFSIRPNTFLPGAMADSLTSYAGMLYEPNDNQTTLLAFLNAGATGSYGTIIEPCAYFEKFPSPQTYFYQARGFTLAECYYQAVTNPYQGLLVGEPLAAPFAQPAASSWLGLATNALLVGSTNLAVRFDSTDALHPLQQIDLFVDGRWLRTLTNVVPAPGNILQVNLNGHAVNYTVPAGATLASIVNDLTSELNLPAQTNTTRIQALAHGDRIELQSTDLATLGEQISVSALSSPGAAPTLTTYLVPGNPEFLDTIASGLGRYFIQGNPTTNTYLRCTVTKVNSTKLNFGVTNTTGTLTLSQMAQQLLGLVNSSPSLQQPDGLTAQDFIRDYPGPLPAELVEFNLVANTSGWSAAQIRVDLGGSSDLIFDPDLPGKLDYNLHDLQPRNHLYVTAGVTNLAVTFGLDSSSLADGFHDLTAVAYEGSHVRTQQRVGQAVRIQNTALSATFGTSNPGTNVAFGADLNLSVVANTNAVPLVSLFSTGGLIGSVSNQPNASFTVDTARLGVGVHPFYAIVSGSNGVQYQTETLWFRVVRSEPLLSVAITAPPPELFWPAMPGRSYDILTTTNLGIPFQVAATLTPSNSPAHWTDPNPSASQRFYRVRTSN
jgi:uncharacterized protein (TIGR03790 family)